MRRRTMLAGLAAAGAAGMARAAVSPVALELFTSQGCSSCPPADALLGELARRPDVIALAWHVDYWDNLGWRDPFASRLATERQRAYARQLHGEVFTPGLVVNGTALVVGSDRRGVLDAIAHARAVSVPVALRRADGGLVAEISGLPGPHSALLAIYNPEHATPVGAGENAGRTLREYRVVRIAQAVDVSGGAGQTLRFTLPAPGQGAALLLQDEALHVVGAADLPATGAAAA